MILSTAMAVNSLLCLVRVHFLLLPDQSEALDHRFVVSDNEYKTKTLQLFPRSLGRTAAGNLLFSSNSALADELYTLNYIN